MNIISLLFDNLALVAGALILAVLGWLGFSKSRAVKRAEEAEAETAEAERQVQESQGVATAQDRAHKAIAKSRAKAKPAPTKKTPGAFETKR